MGTSGNTQGERKDASPAKNATPNVSCEAFMLNKSPLYQVASLLHVV
jgi:hypothetical protein